jgi:hypothetical protein
VWALTPPAAEFYDPVWIVDDTLVPRRYEANEKFCARLPPAHVRMSQQDQLRLPLLHGTAKQEPGVPLDQAITKTKFIARRGWDVAGMRPDDVAVRSFVVRYLGTILKEVASRRAHRQVVEGRAPGDTITPKVAAALTDDVEWLERAVVEQYIAAHHPSRAMPAPPPVMPSAAAALPRATPLVAQSAAAGPSRATLAPPPAAPITTAAAPLATPPVARSAAAGPSRATPALLPPRRALLQRVWQNGCGTKGSEPMAGH